MCSHILGSLSSFEPLSCFFCLEPQFPLFRIYIWKTDFLHICSFPLDCSLDECRPIVYPKKNCTRYMSMFRGVGLFPPLLAQDIFFGLFGVFTVQCGIPLPPFLFVAWIPVRLDIHVPSSTPVLFLGALTGVEQRVLHRGDFLNHCSVVHHIMNHFHFLLPYVSMS